MKYKLIISALVALGLGCQKENDSGDANLSQVDVSGGVQEIAVSAGNTYSIQAPGISMSALSLAAGSFSGSQQIAVRSTANFVQDNISDIFSLDDSYEISQQTSGIELRPLQSFEVDGDFDVTLSVGSDFIVSADATHVFYKISDKEGRWKQGVLAGDDLTISGQSVSFKVGGFGRLALINLSAKLEESAGPISEGAGYYYGIDSNLYRDLINPTADGPDLSSYRFDKNGVVVAASANGTDYIPDPFDFTSMAEDKASTLYEASSEAALKFALTSHDSDYVLWFDLRNSEAIHTVRFLQKDFFDTKPTAAHDLEKLSGSYHGSSASFAKKQASYALEDYNENNRVTLSADGNDILISGQFLDEEIGDSRFTASSDAAGVLGYYKGAVDGRSAFLLVSQDGGAFGLVVCAQAEGDQCLDGDGNGSFSSPEAYRFAVYSKL